MPSSLAVSLSSASVFSTRPPVSVCGTGGPRLTLRSFSREHDYRRCRPAPRGRAYCRGSAHARICLRDRRLPPFNGLFRQPAGVPLLRLSFAARAGDGMLTVSSIGVASRLSLRARLTPGRLAWPGKPRSSGEGVSRPRCRYSCLHLLFRALQRPSWRAFGGAGMLPYRRRDKRGAPRLRHRAYARLSSTRGRSTGELLRTL